MMETSSEAPVILPIEARLTTATEFDSPALGPRPVVLTAAVAGLLLFVADHDWFISRYEDFTMSSDFMQSGAASGNLIRGSAIFVLGAAGVATLVCCGGYKLRIRGLLGAFILAMVAWCAASWFWSIEPSIAMRRLVSSGCMALAALAAAKLLTPRELAAVALACGAAYLAIGLSTEVALGTFQPWHGNYRFSGTLHPNHQGLNCALIVMAAMYLAQGAARHRKVLWSLAAAGLAGLWMTKSRTPLAALVVAEILFLFITVAWKKKMVGALAAVGLTCVAMLVARDQLIDKVVDAALLGRADEEEVGMLTGRVPLWEELSESVAERPLAGFGFSSFWNPKHIEDISDSQSWAISVAHSTYLDLTLGIGLIGAGMCVVVVLLGLVRSLVLNATHPTLGYGFIAMLLLFVLLHGLLESAFANPGFVPLVAYAGLAMVAFVDPQAYMERVPSATLET